LFASRWYWLHLPLVNVTHVDEVRAGFWPTTEMSHSARRADTLPKNVIPVRLQQLRRLGFACRWLTAVLLALLPIIVALDYGGVLRWTQYIAAQAAFWIVLLAIVGCMLSSDWGDLKQHMLLVPLAIWLGFALFQTVPLSAGVIETLSPASANAYTRWINPYLADGERLSSFPISIARHESQHGCAILAVVIAIVWASSTLFSERSKLAWLMVAFSLGASLQACIGAWRLAFPESDAISREFGTFVNRNNAALLLNLGLGCSLGLIAWRLAALRGGGGYDDASPGGVMLQLFRDRDSFAGLFGCACCLIGILICGSRGGLISACLGMLLTFFCVRQRRGYQGAPVILLVLIASIGLLTVPLNIKLESIDRLNGLTLRDASVMQEGRLMHWRDGWTTAGEHFPAGSGLGTYAYAYLPFQEFSSGSWFHHADNLWLELATEQGIIGAVLALSILAISIIAIRRLAHSPDPIDYGLRITGTFCLIAIVVSQLFDFGLIVYGNLLAVAILIPVLVARASNVPLPSRVEKATQPRIQRQKVRTTTALLRSRRRVAAVAVALTMPVLAAAALPTLGRSAHAELAIREVEANRNTWTFDLQRSSNVQQRLANFVGKEDTPAILLAQSDVEYAVARLEEVIASEPTSPDEFAQRYLETDVSQKRRLWLEHGERADEDLSADPQPTTALQARSSYENAYRIAVQTLKVLPLSRQARSNILYLDFVPQNLQMTRSNLEQLKTLFRKQPSALIDIGRFAADSGENELAVDAWRRALILEPRRTPSVLALISQYGQYDAADVLPSDPAVFRSAAAVFLRDVETYRQGLQRARQELRCETCQTNAERSDCEELLGDIELALDQHSSGLARYREAIRLASRRKGVWLKLIKGLQRHGDPYLAR
jgi:tetratricopeptide (TPR) repeat protein